MAPLLSSPFSPRLSGLGFWTSGSLSCTEDSQRELHHHFLMSTILALLIVQQVLGDCLTPWGELGECVHIKDCPRLQKILDNKPLLPMNEKILNQAVCGIDDVNYKVCCTAGQNPHQTMNIPRYQTSESPDPVDNTNDSCTGLSGRRGNCINIKKCGKMMDIWSKRPMTGDDRSFLHRFHCGYEGIYPKVCCEIENALNPEEVLISGATEAGGQCISSPGRKRKCVSIKQCQRMITLLQQTPLTQEIRDHLRHSQCGYENSIPKVCCDIEEDKNPVHHSQSPGDDCITLWGGLGRCISINNCEVMKKIHRQNPLPPMHEKLLETARCGLKDLRDPEFRVCCGAKQAKLETSSEKSDGIGENMLPQSPGGKGSGARLLPHDVCGPIPEARIFGGGNAGVHEFPWMALLEYNVERKGGNIRCAGTLISEKYVLTAAHCLTALPPGLKLIKVRLGEYDRSTEEDCDEDHCIGKYQEFLVEHTKAHQNYSETTFKNDIGLVKLRDPVDIRSGYIRPICLPMDPQSSSGTQGTPSQAVVTGWGATKDGANSMSLRKVTLPILTNDLCQELYRPNQNVSISQNQLCAGGGRNKDSCSGDSGGPLQAIGMYGGRPSFVQYGIVSLGHESCGVEGAPGIYTRVSHYVQWILDNMID